MTGYIPPVSQKSTWSVHRWPGENGSPNTRTPSGYVAVHGKSRNGFVRDYRCVGDRIEMIDYRQLCQAEPTASRGAKQDC